MAEADPDGAVPARPAAGRKAFPLRLTPEVYDAIQRWAAEDLRSVNGQIEFLLRESLRGTGRLRDGKWGGLPTDKAD